MATLREVIAQLQEHKFLLDKEVAFTFYSAEDVELLIDELDTELSAEEVWNSIVDDVQDELNEGFWVEKISEGIGEMLSDKYGWKE